MSFTTKKNNEVKTAEQQERQLKPKSKTKQAPVLEPEPEQEPEQEPENLEEVDEPDENETKIESTDEEIEKMIAENKKSKKVEFVSDDIVETIETLTKLDMEIESQNKYRKVVFKNLQKLISKYVKRSKNRKSRLSDTPKGATGFIKAIHVPENFVTFYKKHFLLDEEFKKNFSSFDITMDMPRTVITKMIYHYIRSNNLYGVKEDGSQDKRNIVPNNELKTLLSIREGENIGFNNFQSYITRLYSSSIVVEENEEVIEVVVGKPKGNKKTQNVSNV